MMQICVLSVTLVKDAVLKNVLVMDALAQLDKCGSKSKKGYVHLAHYFGVPNKQLLKIKASEANSSPCDCLFFYLTTIKPDIRFKEIKEALKDLGRNDVIANMEEMQVAGECLKICLEEHVVFHIEMHHFLKLPFYHYRAHALAIMSYKNIKKLTILKGCVQQRPN